MNSPRRPLLVVASGAFAVLAAVLWFRPFTPARAPRTAVQPPVPSAPLLSTAPGAPSPTPPPTKAPASTAPAAAAVKPNVSPAFAAFDEWAERFVTAAAPEQTALLPAGQTLARARRTEMLDLIRQDPQRALAEAVPYGLRRKLPAAVTGLIEQPFTTFGGFERVHIDPLPGFEDRVRTTEYWLTLGRKRIEAFTYGSRQRQPSHSDIPLYGVVLADDMGREVAALSADSVRVLSAEEARDVVAAGRITLRATPRAPANQPAIIAQIGDQFRQFGSQRSLADLDRQMTAALGRVWASGAAVSDHAVEDLPPPNPSLTQGIKRLLYMPVLFADDPVPPQTPDGAQATARANNQFYNDGSYGTVHWLTTVTPPLQLPHKKTVYGEVLPLTLLDALAVATSLGYPVNEYDQAYVLFNSLPQASFGGRSDGLLNASPGAISHELGHNFGLPHANYWDTSGKVPGPIQPTNAPPYPIDPDSTLGHDDVNAPWILGVANGVPIEEYGDPYDVMGSGGGHFNVIFKNDMQWLPDRYVRTIRTSQTNRVYAFDIPRITDGRTYALKVNKDALRDYWLSVRQGFPENPWFSHGVEVMWNSLFFGKVLIDTTPTTTSGKNDAAVVVGRTFSDPESDIHVTPVAQQGDGSNRWVDIVVNLGPYPTNVVPTLSLTTTNTQINTNTTLALTATAQDANGDTLAYNWDFGDGSFGSNQPVMLKTFAFSGQYVVRCEASDMKGGVASAFVVVTVGTPTNFVMTGRVVDQEGRPVEGVRVHNGGTPPPYQRPPIDGAPPAPFTNNAFSYRFSYTDSQGYYAIGNIPPGVYTNGAFKFGFRLDPDFVNPINLTSANAANLNYVATELPRVTISHRADAPENGSSPGGFVIRRTGDLTKPLPVRYIVNGTAEPGLDYEYLTGMIVTNFVVTTNMGMAVTNQVVTTGTIAEVTIPVNEVSVDLDVTAIDNLDGKGNKDLFVTLLLQTNEWRVTTIVTNILTTNQGIVITNSMFIDVSNQFRIPGWEARAVGPSATLIWYQTLPTYVIQGSEAVVQIQDNEVPGRPMVSVTAVDTAASETRSDSATLMFSRTMSTITNDLVIRYRVSGDASNGVDFGFLPGVVTIPAGEEFALVFVHAVNDLFVEGNETFFVTITPDPAYDIGEGNTVVTVLDDDLPLITVYASDAIASRVGGNSGTITFSRAGDLTEALSIDYLVSGSGVSGIDFDPLPQTVVIPPGQITANVVIRPRNTPGSVGPKTVTLLVSDSPSYNIFNQNTATVMIQDDLPTVTLAVTSANAAEGGGQGVFTVSRSAPPTNDLNVFFTVGGSAFEGSDYSPIGTNVIIPAGFLSATITIAATGASDDRFREFGDVTGEDTVILQLRAGPNYNLGNQSSGTVRILDNDPVPAFPSVGFMVRNSTFREDNGVAFVLVKVSANPETNFPIRVEYKVVGGNAVTNINYIGIPGITGVLDIVHFDPPPGGGFVTPEDTIYVIQIPILDDLVAAGDKSIVLRLFNPSGYVTNMSLATNGMGMVLTNVLITPIPTNAFLGDFNTHTITLVDVGEDTVGIAADVDRVYEAGPVSGTFTISRDGPVDRPLTVVYSVGGTAADGSDYDPITTNGLLGAVTIPAGTNAVTIEVVPKDDPEEEVAENVVVTLLPRPGYKVGADVSQIIIVSDDGTYQFTSATFDVAENAGPAVISVTRTGRTNSLGSVDYEINDGTAVTPEDYSAANGTLTFLPGESVKTFSIALVNDSVVEPDETVLLTLSNPAGGVALGGQRSAVLTIVNDDITFEFSTNQFLVAEDGTNGRVQLIRRGSTNGSVSVTLSTSDGSATNLMDYRAFNSAVTFAPGVASRTVSIDLLDDVLFEGNEVVGLRLSNPSVNTTLGAISNATLTILDDECSIALTATNYFVNEYEAFAQLVITRAGGTPNPVRVDYRTRNGTASNTFDYIAQMGTLDFAGDAFVLDTNGSGTLLFQPGESNKTVNVLLLDDSLGEGSEVFTFALTNARAATTAALAGATVLGRLGTPTSATVTILDDEQAGRVDYGYNNSFGPNGRVLTVAYQPDGKTVFGGEFTTVNGILFNRVSRLLPNGSLDNSFNTGLGANSTVSVVASQPDGKVLIAGEFTTFNGTNRVRIARLNADGSLDLSFNPGAGVNGLIRTIALQADGSVVIGGDFTSVAGQTRTRLARFNTVGTLDGGFAPTASASVYSIAVQPDGKLVVGGGFTNLSGMVRFYVGRLNTNGTVDNTFTAGDGPNARVNSLAVQPDGRIVLGGNFTVVAGYNWPYAARLESNGAVDNSFAIGSGPNGPVLAVGVHSSGRIYLGGSFTGINGTGRNRYARLRPNGSLDTGFDPGTGANLSVQSLAVQPDTAVVIGGDFTVVNGLTRRYITRIHGDENFTGAEFSSATYTVAENAGPATITVLRVGATNTVFSVRFVATNGTALAGSDFTGRAGTLNFAAGQSSATFTVNITDDALLEGDETITLYLTNASAGVMLSGLPGATLIIRDNENSFQLASGTYTATENAGTALIAVQRRGSAGPASVNYAAANGTAIAGSDFIGVTNTLNFAAGETSKTFTVTLLDDVIGELAESVNLRLFNAVGATLASPSNAVLTIIDNDTTYGTVIYTNTAAITLVDGNPASPYPSTINVAGITGSVNKVTVSFVGLYHTFPADIDAVLVGPQGQSVLLMSDAGGNPDAVNLTLTFDDASASVLPLNAALTSGTNRPTDYAPADTFIAPAPAGPYASALTTFIGTDPTGPWKLYAMDDRGADSGVISNGWRLSITTVDPATSTDLALSMEDMPDPITAGQTLTYAITVTNGGSLVAANVAVLNPLPASVNFVGAMSSQGTCTNNSGRIHCTLGTLAGGASATVSVLVTPIIAGTLTNSASVTSSVPDVFFSNNVATVLTTVDPAATADLVLTLVDSPDPVLAGADLAYFITVTNRGPLTAHNVVIKDPLPDVLDFFTAVTSQGTFWRVGDKIIFGVGTLAPGQGVAVTMITRARAAGIVTNSVTAFADEMDIDPENRATVTTEVTPAADLVLTASDFPDPAPVNGQITYTYTVVNNGPSAAAGVTLFSALPAQLTIQSLSSSQGSNFAGGGAAVFALGDVPAGGLVTATLLAGTLLDGLFTNQSTLVSAVADADESNNRFEAVTRVGAVPVNSGLVIVRNTNANDLAAVVTAQGVAGIRVTSSSLQSHTRTNGPTTSGLFFIGTPPATYGLTTPGIVLSTGDVLDYGGGTNTTTGRTTAYGVPATTAQEALLDPITGGGGINFSHFDTTQLDIRFDMLVGFDRVTFDVVFGSEEYEEFVGSDYIDGFGIYLNGVNIAFSGGLPVNINHPDMMPIPGTELDGVLAPDQNPVVRFTAAVAPGSIGNTLTFIVADTSDSVLDTTVYVSSLQGSVGPNADLGVTLSGTPNPVVQGDAVTFTAAVTNRGPYTATNVALLAPIPAGMNFVGASATQGSCTLSNTTVVCQLNALPNLGRATVTITAVPVTPARYTNTVTVASGLPDVVPFNNVSTVFITAIETGAAANPDVVLLPDGGKIPSYPSIITVSNRVGRIVTVSATLVGLTHTFPADLDVLLVGPSGRSVILMSDVGAGVDVNGLTLRFDDAAGGYLATNGPLVSGTFKPTDAGGDDTFSLPAPSGPYGATLGVFQGTIPNGDWLLFVMDDQGSDGGILSGGWQVNITTAGAVEPEMSAGIEGSEIVLRWPAAQTGFVVESGDLSEPLMWTQITFADPPVVGGYFEVRVPLTAGAQYFRLRQP